MQSDIILQQDHTIEQKYIPNGGIIVDAYVL